MSVVIRVVCSIICDERCKNLNVCAVLIKYTYAIEVEGRGED